MCERCSTQLFSVWLEGKWCRKKIYMNFLVISLIIIFPSGALSTQVSLDREQQAEYELWVLVSDGQLSSVTPVFITVNDVNDNPPEFLESLYRVTIPARSKTKKREALFRVSPIGVNPDTNVVMPSVEERVRSAIKLHEHKEVNMSFGDISEIMIDKQMKIEQRLSEVVTMIINLCMLRDEGKFMVIGCVYD